MPYSDLSDAWNSYDPRYRRVSDDAQGNETSGSAPPPADDEPSWPDVYSKYINSISNIGAPPRDQVILAPGQDEGGRFGTHPLADQAAGIYLYDQHRQAKPPPAGDVVLPSTSSQPGELYTNPTQSTVWPSVARRMRDDINQQYNSGALADEEAGRGWARGKYDTDLILKELEQRAKGDGPSWLRRIGYDGAPIGAAPPSDAPQIQGPTRPGFNDPAVLARVYGDIQRDLRLNPDQALGFLSNLNAESFGFAKAQEEGPQIRGRNTGGLGWGQWTAGRRAAFEDYLRQTGAPPTSYEGNYGFLTTELQDPKWQPFLENLRRQRDAESATRYTERGYENPSRKTGRQDWLARTRRELPASQNALGQVQGSAPPAPNSLETARFYTSLPPNYLRPQPYATGSSELYRENLLF